jgi:hypothetical protein
MCAAPSHAAISLVRADAEIASMNVLPVNGNVDAVTNGQAATLPGSVFSLGSLQCSQGVTAEHQTSAFSWYRSNMAAGDTVVKGRWKAKSRHEKKHHLRGNLGVFLTCFLALLLSPLALSSFDCINTLGQSHRNLGRCMIDGVEGKLVSRPEELRK